MIEDMKLIEQLEFYQCSNERSKRILLEQGFLKTVPKGTHLFRDKETVTMFYIVLSGYVSLYKLDCNGEKKVIFILGSGKLVNDISLQSLPSSSHCEVIKEAIIFCIKKQALMTCLSQDFVLTSYVMDAMALKIRRCYRQLKNTSSSLCLDKRIAAKIWKFGHDFGTVHAGQTEITVDISITYLAEIIGSKRETVSRQIKKLTELGLLSYEKHHFIIPDMDQLKQFYKGIV